MYERTSKICLTIFFSVALIIAEPATADCFGSTDWFAFTNGTCLTTNSAEWSRVAQAPDVVSFDPGGPGVPVLVDGSPPGSNVDLSLISEIVLDGIGDNDYAGDGVVLPTPNDQRLTAGAITELFQGIPELAPGSLFTPQFPSVLDLTTDPGNGFLSLWLEPGATILIDFDDRAQRPRAWGATFANVVSGTVALHAVFGDADAGNGMNDVPSARTSVFDVQSGFLGLTAPEGMTLARLQLVLAGGSGSAFRIDDVSYASSIVPEPSTALFMGLGLIGLARGSRGAHFATHRRTMST